MVGDGFLDGLCSLYDRTHALLRYNETSELSAFAANKRSTLGSFDLSRLYLVLQRMSGFSNAPVSKGAPSLALKTFH